MDRRDILKASAIFLGYGLVGGTSLAVLNGCKAETGDGWVPSFFTPEQIDLLAEISERMIPKSDTPGAKDAFVHRYIDEAVKNNFRDKEKEEFKIAIEVFDIRAKAEFNSIFVDISDKEKDKILQDLANEAKAVNGKGQPGSRIFFDIKSLVVAGYFTSEEGATQALIYDPVPGPYQGCIPFSKVGGVYSL